MFDIRIYETEKGKSPYSQWVKELSLSHQAIIQRRMLQVEKGNFGDTKSIKGKKGLFELRIHVGPGYRVYYGRRGRTVVMLLCGGSKGTQSRDINKAAEYWQNYLKNGEEYEK